MKRGGGGGGGQTRVYIIAVKGMTLVNDQSCRSYDYTLKNVYCGFLDIYMLL